MKTQWKARKASRRDIFSFSIELRVPRSVSLWQRRAGVATSRQSRTPSGPLCWSFSPCRPSPLRREDSWDRNISLRSDSVLSRHSTSWSWRDRGTGPAMSSPSAPSWRRREIEILWRAALQTSPTGRTARRLLASTVWRTAPPSVSSLGNVEKRYIKKNEKVSVLFFFEAFNNLLFQEYILYEFDVQSNWRCFNIPSNWIYILIKSYFDVL